MALRTPPGPKRAPQQRGAFIAIRDCAGVFAFYYNPSTRQIEIKIKAQTRIIDLSAYHREDTPQ